MEGSYEAETCTIEVKSLHLPTGQIKRNVLLNLDNSVREEKERLLREASIPYPVLYVLVIYGHHGSYQVLDDNNAIEYYLDSLQGGAECELHIKKRDSQVERPARSVKPELFNINMK